MTTNQAPELVFKQKHVVPNFINILLSRDSPEFKKLELDDLEIDA